MRKGILAAAMVFILAVMSACGNGTAKSGASADTAGAAGADAEGKVKLKVLCCIDPEVEGNYRLEIFKEVAADLGYEIDVERTDDDTFKTKIRVALQGNELPDIFYTWGAAYSEPFIRSGALYPLDEAIAESGYDFYDTYLNSDDGHVYALPMNAFEAYGVFYNKNVLNKLNAQLPTTWDELLEFVDLCNANGITAIALGNKERWEGDLMYNSLVMMEDTEAFKKALSGEMSFTDAPFLEAAKKVETLVQRGAFQNGYMQHSDSEAVELIKADEAAMYWIGPWMIANMTEGELGEKMGYATLPKMSDAVDPKVSSCTNATDAGFAVSARSPYAKEAAKLVVEYTKRINDYGVALGNVPVMNSPDAIPPENIHEINQVYAQQMEDLIYTQLWWFSSVDSKYGEPMRDLSHQQFAGQISPEDFVKELERIMP